MYPWFGDWAFTLKNPLDLRKKWLKIPKDTDVLITHGPPYGIGDDASPPGSLSKNNVGCKELRKIIDKIQPKLHVFGHIHIGYGTYKVKNTTLVNAAISNDRYKITHLPVVFDLP